MATTSHNPHPLIGKLISLDSEDHGFHTISRFTAEIGPGLMLAKRINPHTKKDLAESHIIVLAQVAQDEMTLIFDSWAAYERWHECPHEERVVRLVPKDEQ